MEYFLGINLQDAEGYRLPPSGVHFRNCLYTVCVKLLVFLVGLLISVNKKKWLCLPLRNLRE